MTNKFSGDWHPLGFGGRRWLQPKQAAVEEDPEVYTISRPPGVQVGLRFIGLSMVSLSGLPSGVKSFEDSEARDHFDESDRFG